MNIKNNIVNVYYLINSSYKNLWVFYVLYKTEFKFSASKSGYTKF